VEKVEKSKIEELILINPRPKETCLKPVPKDYQKPKKVKYDKRKSKINNDPKQNSVLEYGEHI